MIFTILLLFSSLGPAEAQSTDRNQRDEFEEVQPEFSAFRKVPFHHVKVRDPFWSPRIKSIQDTTIPFLLDVAEQQGKLDNLRIIAGRKSDGKIKKYNSPDSDIWKIMEAAAYTLAWRDDPELERRLDALIELYADAQADNGYINQMYMLPDDHPQSPEDPSWDKGYGKDERFKGAMEDWPSGIGQFYSTGHLLDAAVAYYRATGKTNFLDVATGMADRIYEAFPPGEPIDYADHTGLGLGLMKLYEVTGKKRYLKLANHIIHHGNHARPVDRGGGESALPLREQRQAWGHAVRINYLYSGATDLARYLKQPETRTALDSLWHSIVDRRIYLHGGVGGPANAEQLARDWKLNPRKTYSESCANIAHAEWNHRLNLMNGLGKYADLVEIEAFNGAISGLGQDGKSFLYCNQTVIGKENRNNIKSGVRGGGLFCCQSNLPTMVGGISRFIYAKQSSGLVVNQYIGSTVKTQVGGESVTLKQEIRYPWNGRVRLSVQPERARQFTLSLRIPGWAFTDGPHPSDLYTYAVQKRSTVRLTVNGENQSVNVKNGYVHLDRTWKPGDEVVLNLSMPVRRVYSHPNAIPTNGKVALMRGPVLYALEGADNDFNVFKTVLRRENEVQATHRPDLLGGVTVLRGTAGLKGTSKKVQFTAIPYHAWQNRGIHRMTVWMHDPDAPELVEYSLDKPAKASNIWKDRVEQNGPDKAVDGKMSTRWATDSGLADPWIEIDLEKKRTISAIRMWEAFPGRIQEYTLEYRSNGEWKTIYNGTTVGESFVHHFDPVTARRVRLNIHDATNGPTLKEIKLFGPEK